MLILMDLTVGLYGMIWTQLVVEVIMLPVSLGMYRSTFRHLPPAEGRAGTLWTKRFTQENFLKLLLPLI